MTGLRGRWPEHEDDERFLLVLAETSPMEESTVATVAAPLEKRSEWSAGVSEVVAMVEEGGIAALTVRLFACCPPLPLPTLCIIRYRQVD